MKIMDGVLVLIITVCSYLFSYSYYLGYFRTKDIPVEFIDIGLSSMLKVGVFIIAIFSLISFFIDILALSEKDDIEDDKDNFKLDENWKSFFIRHSLIIITLILAAFDFFTKPTFDKFSLIAFIVFFTFVFEFSLTEKTGHLKWYQKRYTIQLKPARPSGTVQFAHKFKMSKYFAYLSWILAALLLIYFMGVTSANREKEVLLCNKDLKVLQVNPDTVLVTKDYKHFAFLEKTECNFYIRK